MIKNNRLVFVSVLLIGIASCTGYLATGQSFWAGELPLPLILGLMALVCLVLIQKVPVRLNSFDLVFLGYHAYLFINSAVHSFPFAPTDKIILALIVVLFYLLIRRVMVDEQQKKTGIITQGIIILALLQSVLGILQYVGILSPFHQDYRSVGLFINPAIYGGFLAVGFCLAVLNLANWPRKNRLLWGSIVLIIGISLLLSHSLTACIAAMVGLAGILCTLYPRHIKNLFHNTPLLIAIGAAIVVSAFLIFSKMDFGSFRGRILIWKVGLGMVLDSPFFGHSYGSFFSRYSDYQANYFMSGKGSTAEMQLAAINYYAFNEPLRILVEEGIMGLLIFMGLTGSVFMACRRNPDPASGLPFLIPLVVISVFALFSYPFADISLSMIFALSIAGIAPQKTVAVLSPSVLKVSDRKWNHYFRHCILLLCIIGSAVRIYAIFRWKDAKEHLSTQEGDSLRTYHMIYPLLCNNGHFLYNYGSELLELGQYQQALNILERSLHYGNGIAHHLAIAETQRVLRNLSAAERNYIKAAYIDPKRFVPFFTLFQFYRETRKTEKAGRIAAMLCAKPVKIPSETIDRIKNETCTYEN